MADSMRQRARELTTYFSQGGDPNPALVEFYQGIVQCSDDEPGLQHFLKVAERLELPDLVEAAQQRLDLLEMARGPLAKHVGDPSIVTLVRRVEEAVRRAYPR